VEAYAVGVKEIIQLGSEQIDQRFNLAPGCGAARLYLGHVTHGLPGGGFLYTNKDSVSIGLVVHLHALQSKPSESRLGDLLEDFKNRPDVAPLIAGGKTAEYGAHLVPEGGFRHLPEAGRPGLLLAGDAAGLVATNGVVLRGMDLALASGSLAGQATVETLKAGQSPEQCLNRYRQLLDESFVLRTLRVQKKASAVLSVGRLYDRYPKRLVRWTRDFFEVGSRGDNPTFKQAFRRLRREVLGWRGIRDLWRLTRM
jgi:electron transfer flavoprotein-quinone oxidoreductase